MAASAQDVVHCLCALEADADGGGPVIDRLRLFERAGAALQLQRMQHDHLLSAIHHTHNTFSRILRSFEGWGACSEDEAWHSAVGIMLACNQHMGQIHLCSGREAHDPCQRGVVALQAWAFLT